MSFVKSFFSSFIIFIILNFILNILIVIAVGTINFGLYTANIEAYPLSFIGTLFAISNFGVLPPVVGIFYGVNSGIESFSYNILLGILLILTSFLPPLIASILAGKMADNSKQAIASFMSTMMLSTIILMIFYLMNPFEMATFIIFINMEASVSTVAVLIFVFGAFNGIMWSSLSAIINKEDKIKK